MKHILFFLLIFIAAPIVCMETVPNEVIRMFFEHMTHKQRKSVARVSIIWNFLVNTFPPPKKMFKNHIKICVMQTDKFIKFQTMHDKDKYDISHPIEIFKDHINTFKQYLENNKITPRRVGIILPKNFCMSDLEQNLANNSDITSIEMCTFSSQNVKRFSELLNNHPQVNNISVYIGDSFNTTYFLDALKQSKHIQQLEITSMGDTDLLENVLKETTNITHLILNIAILTGFLERKFELFEKNNTICRLDLSSTAFTQNTFNKLVSIAKQKKDFKLILRSMNKPKDYALLFGKTDKPENYDNCSKFNFENNVHIKFTKYGPINSYGTFSYAR